MITAEIINDGNDQRTTEVSKEMHNMNAKRKRKRCLAIEAVHQFIFVCGAMGIFVYKYPYSAEQDEPLMWQDKCIFLEAQSKKKSNMCLMKSVKL